MSRSPIFNHATTSEEVVNAFASRIHDRTVLITGVSPNGLGAAMAIALASQSPKLLIITARSPEKAQGVVDKTFTAYPDVKIQIVQLDLSSVPSIRAAAASVSSLTAHIDVLINNAGVMAIPKRTLSETGEEMHFATNYLGHFLFTNLLMPLLLPEPGQPQVVATSRIVNVVSAGFHLIPMRFSDLTFSGTQDLPAEEQPNTDIAEAMGLAGLDPQSGYHPMLAYSHSSTALMLFTAALADRLQGKGVAAFSAAPGVSVTELQKHLPEDFRNEKFVYKTHSQAASSFLVAAFDERLDGQSGDYVDDCVVKTWEVPGHAKDLEVASKLWELSEDRVGRKFDF